MTSKVSSGPFMTFEGQRGRGLRQHRCSITQNEAWLIKATGESVKALVEVQQLLHPALSPRCAFKKHRCSSRSASLHLRAPWLRDGSPSAAAAAAASFLPVATTVSSIRTRRQRWRSLIGRVRFPRASLGRCDIGTPGDAFLFHVGHTWHLGCVLGRILQRQATEKTHFTCV